MTDPTTQYRQKFNEDGFLILHNHFEAADIEQLLRIWRADSQLASDIKENTNFEGDEGLRTRLAYRPHLTDDAYGALARSARLVSPLEQIFGGPMQHYYTLNMQKDPGTGGWEYHQDYGYHYNEFLYPDFVSVMVALDPATRENGCLRVVRGSHRLGRLEHQAMGSQRIADPERVAMAMEELEEVHCEMGAGSVLYFHGNMLHASNANTSDTSRWCLIFAYVPVGNRWVLADAPQLSRVDGIDDDALRTEFSAHEGRIPETTR